MPGRDREPRADPTTARGPHPRQQSAGDDKSDLATLVRRLVQTHGFHRVHASCAIVTPLGAVAAVWVPLLIGAGRAPSIPRLIVSVLVAVWLVGFTLNSLVVWVLVRIQPSRARPHDLAANRPCSAAGAATTVGNAPLLRLVALPAAAAGAALRQRPRRGRMVRNAAVMRDVPADVMSEESEGSVAAQRVESSRPGVLASRRPRTLVNRMWRALPGRHSRGERKFG